MSRPPVDLTSDASYPGAPDSRSVNAYLRTRVLTARAEELRLILLEAALKFARQGRDAMARKEHEAQFNALSQCRDIVVELMTSVREDAAPELVANVRSVYSYLYRTLVEAGFEKDLAKLDKVIELLEYERQTWELLIEKLASERAGAAPDAGMDQPRASFTAQA